MLEKRVKYFLTKTAIVKPGQINDLIETTALFVLRGTLATVS